MGLTVYNIPDDCANNPLAPWNEKPVHPGDVFELAEKCDTDALDYIGDHGGTWLSIEVLAMCIREIAIGCITCADLAEDVDRLLVDCHPVGLFWIGGDSWLAQVAREAIGESVVDNMSDRDLGRLVAACAQAGAGVLSPEFPRAEFDSWQDMCQRDWEAEA